MNTLVPTEAVAPLINGVSYEEQLLGKLLQKLTKLYNVWWKLWNQLMKLLSSPLPPSR